MKATDIIKRDHTAAKELFKRFKEAPENTRETMEAEVFDALTAHERMEDKHFYPALKDKMEDTGVLMKLEMEQKKLEAEVLAARALPGDRAKRIMAMTDMVLAHAEKEELELFPLAEELLGAEELESLGKKMEPESAAAQQK